MTTTSTETVSTGVLDWNKEHYLVGKDQVENSYDVSRHIQLYMSKYKNKGLQSIVSNLQPNCCLNVDFQKVDKHSGINIRRRE